MGLLAYLWGDVSDDDTLFKEGLVDAICAAVAFDDEVTEDEVERAVEFIIEHMEVSEEEAEDLIDEGFERIAERSFDDIIEDIVDRVDHQSQAQLIILAALTISEADGGWFSSDDEDEEDYLMALVDAFGFNDEEMDDVHMMYEQTLRGE